MSSEKINWTEIFVEPLVFTVYTVWFLGGVGGLIYLIEKAIEMLK